MTANQVLLKPRYGLPAKSPGKKQGKGTIACPQCNHPINAVIDARRGPDGSFRRRRVCMGCQFRFTTYEHVAGAYTTDYQI